jgi:ADP-ribose pyrophosphatase YjhB (NUDIX family)
MVVALVVRRAGEVLLVGQRSPSGDVVWSLPAGQVEPFEGIPGTAERELREETGLRLDRLVRLAYVVHVNRPAKRDRTVALVFDCETTGEVVVDDPDGDVVAAEFVSPTVAIARLEALPSRVMREPAIAYLEGRLKAGTFLSYRDVDGVVAPDGQVGP